MAASFVQAVVSGLWIIRVIRTGPPELAYILFLGYFAQDKGDIDAESIEEFLTSTDTFQLIAIDQKKSVKFTTADDIPEGCSAIIFKKPKGTKIDMTNLAKSLRKELLDGPHSSKNTSL